MILALNTKYNTDSYIYDLSHSNTDIITLGILHLKSTLQHLQSSRHVTYKQINPHLSIHPIYTEKHTINELNRIAFTRFRVSSHSLAVEVVRWNRRGCGRFPLEERMCTYGKVQTKTHVTEHCPLKQHVRDSSQFSDMGDLFSGRLTDELVCRVVSQILDVYS